MAEERDIFFRLSKYYNYPGYLYIATQISNLQNLTQASERIVLQINKLGA